MRYYNTFIKMKKHILTLFLLSLFAPFCLANVVTGVATVPDNYYVGVNAKSSPDAILDALFDKIKGHTVIAYKSLEPYYEQTDFYADTVWDMYSTCRFTMDDANKAQSAVCDGWNKEHAIPQSWFNEGSPMKSDLFHVYPTDARVNNFRGNEPYGEVAGSNGAGFKDNYQGHGLGKKGSNTFPGYTGSVFEPADEYKGDFARTYFYMVARYRDKNLNSANGSAVFTTNKTNLTEFAKNLFLKWHRQDPVSPKEIDRNQAVYGLQNNRNPFIDYPELVEYIWGNKVGQAVDMSQLTPTCDGGGYTPIFIPKYGVTWSVNGVEQTVDSIQENGSILSLPDEPVSCSAESNTFIGWTTAPIDGIGEEIPSVLYSELKHFPPVTADMTYYAVFAHAVVDGNSAPMVYTYDTNHQDGWTNTATWTNSYWALKANQYLESPTINLTGLSSVSMKMRTYGGGSFNTVNIVANGNTIGTLVAANNSLALQTWTNTASLSGSSALRFEPANANASYGPAFSEVTINATGAGMTYSRFITSCQTATELLRTPDTYLPARKVLIGSQIYILLNNQLFNLQGQRVQ